ncbi:hypothetical protein F4703DRAFT_1882404 [Phycomyces blakesleeanus]
MQSQISKLAIGNTRSWHQQAYLNLVKNTTCLNQLRNQSRSSVRSFVTLKYRPEPTDYNRQQIREERQPTGRLQYVNVGEDKLNGPNKYLYTMPTDPYIASNRINQIIKTSTLDDALNFVNCLPNRLQSTILWNQLIAECASQSKANMAHTLFVRMRKKGLPPNERTFTLLISCFRKSTSPTAGERAKEVLVRMREYNFKPTTIHINALLGVYGKLGQIDNILHNLEDMKDNDIQPDHITYTIALSHCHLLPEGDAVKTVQRLWKEIEDRVELSSETFKQKRTNYSPSQEEENGNGSPVSLLARKAAKVSATERSMKKDRFRLSRETGEIPRFLPDDSLITAFLLALSRTAIDSSDLWFGVRTIEKLYGIRPTQVTRMMEEQKMDTEIKANYHLRVTPKSLYGIMRFCGGLGQYKLGEEYCHLALSEDSDLEFDKDCSVVYEWLEREAKKKVATDSKRWRTRKEPATGPIRKSYTFNTRNQ